MLIDLWFVCMLIEVGCFLIGLGIYLLVMCDVFVIVLGMMI